MKIGIIGAGQIGGTLTRRLTALGHQVSVANSRGPETLAGLAAETGAKPVSVAEAARSGELVIVTIPEKNIAKLPRDLFAGTPDNVVIVDTGNYYPRQRDGRIDAIEAGMTESRWVAQQLNRPVIKAFNNIYARHLMELGRPNGTPGRIALPVAGDDGAAKAVWYCSLSMSLDLMVLMPVASMSPGANNLYAGLRKRLRCRWCSTRAVRGEQRAKTRVACNLEQPTKF